MTTTALRRTLGVRASAFRGERVRAVLQFDTYGKGASLLIDPRRSRPHPGSPRGSREKER
jgi:hypothetical protein